MIDTYRTDKRFDIEIVATLISYDTRVLLLQRAENRRYPKRWSLVGGKVEDGEGPLQAAIREAFEETNIKLSDPQRIHQGVYEVDDVFSYTLYAEHLKSKPVVTLNDEHIRHGWFSIDEIAELSFMFPGESALIREAFKNR